MVIHGSVNLNGGSFWMAHSISHRICFSFKCRCRNNSRGKHAVGLKITYWAINNILFKKKYTIKQSFYTWCDIVHNTWLISLFVYLLPFEYLTHVRWMLTNAICFSNLTFRSDHTRFNFRGNQAGSCTREPSGFGPDVMTHATCGRQQLLYICVMYVKGRFAFNSEAFHQIHFGQSGLTRVMDHAFGSGPKQSPTITPTRATASPARNPDCCQTPHLRSAT